MPDISISSIVPLAFGGVYGWGQAAQGLFKVGIPLGCVLARRLLAESQICTFAGGSGIPTESFLPEFRLHVMRPGIIVMHVELVGFSICVDHETPWMGPVSMMAIAIVEYQKLVSLGMAYRIDCYKPQAPCVAAAMSFCRQLFGFTTVSHRLLPWVESFGFQDNSIAQGCAMQVRGCGPLLRSIGGDWGKKWREGRH